MSAGRRRDVAADWCWLEKGRGIKMFAGALVEVRVVLRDSVADEARLDARLVGGTLFDHHRAKKRRNAA